jgi:hypothetical protein
MNQAKKKLEHHDILKKLMGEGRHLVASLPKKLKNEKP